MDNPYILDENEDFAVVFKPAKIHTTAKNSEQKNEKKEKITLVEWFKSKNKSVYDIMHRLDYETNGLVLFAKTEKSYLFFKEAQKKDKFIKEYSAMCKKKSVSEIKGFPELPRIDLQNDKFVIESYFRPYGPGRKLVRPVIEDEKKHKETAKDRGGFYRTEIINKKGNNFILRIKRGFRHQIRCHLCWIGFPIVNDPLYLYSKNEVEISNDKIMFLRSHAIFFPAPYGEKTLDYRIEPICEESLSL